MSTRKGGWDESKKSRVAAAPASQGIALTLEALDQAAPAGRVFLGEGTAIQLSC
jgi:hypothetical protein